MGFIKALGTPFLNSLVNNILFWASCTTSRMASFFLITYLCLPSPPSDSSRKFPGSQSEFFITDVTTLFSFLLVGVELLTGTWMTDSMTAESKRNHPNGRDDVKAASLELPTWLACSSTGQSLPPQEWFTVSTSQGWMEWGGSCGS